MIEVDMFLPMSCHSFRHKGIANGDKRMPLTHEITRKLGHCRFELGNMSFGKH
jgi:hypothetical protein